MKEVFMSHQKANHRNGRWFGDAAPGSVTPDDPTKNDFSKRTKELVSRLAAGAESVEEGILGQAIATKKDVIQYVPWESSYKPVAVGGYLSRNEILEMLNQIETKLSSKYASSRGVRAVREARAFDPIAANCKDLARDSSLSLILPTSLSEAYFCHPTAVKVGAGVVGLLVLLGILAPYVNLLNKALK